LNWQCHESSVQYDKKWHQEFSIIRTVNGFSSVS